MEFSTWSDFSGIFSSPRFWLYVLFFLAAVRFPPDSPFMSALRQVLWGSSLASSKTRPPCPGPAKDGLCPYKVEPPQPPSPPPP